MLIKKLSTSEAGFFDQLAQLTQKQSLFDEQVEQQVNTIIKKIAADGDSALINYCNTFDRANVNEITELVIPPNHLKRALQEIPSSIYSALQLAIQRIEEYHRHQLQKSWEYEDKLGNKLGQKITPLERVGIYIPGGKASYPSSILMNVIPAKIAGVQEICMFSPICINNANPVILAAAHLVGINHFYAIGGAHSIAAMALGTQSIKKVDKIVGPGNIYVTTAKRLLFGKTGIDMLAGPSEICIYADEQANPNWLAMDLCAQAEHDENAQAIIISTSQLLLDQVELELKKLISTLPRCKIIAASLMNNGALIKVTDNKQAISTINSIASEHLQLSCSNPRSLLKHIKHAGAIFIGYHTPEAFGDYCAGPSHVLPTSTTARFSSPLGVYDFQKRSSLIECSINGAQAIAPVAECLAQAENLDAHAWSAKYRT